MSSEIAIRVQNLSKCYQIYDRPRDRLLQLFARGRKQYYREFWALKGVSFEIKRGETVGIVGRNGSGKSTLLQMICGTLTPTKGTVEIQGRVAALLELGSGFNPEFTGRENVYMNAAVLGLSKGEIDNRFDDIAAFSDIGDFIEQPVKSYSSGMMVRLAFSVAINVNPEILVVDEALSVGDELFQRKCFSRIEAIRASGATILFVSHSGAQIVELCDRAVLMDEGEKLAVGAPKEIVGRYQKLLYAPADKRKVLREQICHEGGRDFSLPDTREVAVTIDSNSIDHAQGLEESFDPHLTSASTIEYESHGAIIETHELYALDGTRANGLIRGRKYRCRYRVAFDKLCTNVRFGMVIKSTTGVHLGGALSAPTMAEAIGFINAGQTVDVEFLFYCHLNPGTYFMNVGVFGFAGDQEVVLYRKVDAIAFRVLPINENIETGMISFGFSATALVL